jgi:hypothetical protein
MGEGLRGAAMVTGGEQVPKRSRRRAIVELAYYCAEHGDPAGPVAAAVTEGREQRVYAHGPGSSCVELADCVAFAAGCRAKSILRDEHLGFPAEGRPDLGWFYGAHDWSVEWYPRFEQLKPGDFLGYDFDRGGHICIYCGQDENGLAVTADYGQPGGKVHYCPVGSGVRVTLRGRQLFAAVDADTIVFTEPALTVAEWCQAHGLDAQPWQPAEYIAQQWEAL